MSKIKLKAVMVHLPENVVEAIDAAAKKDSRSRKNFLEVHLNDEFKPIKEGEKKVDDSSSAVVNSMNKSFE